MKTACTDMGVQHQKRTLPGAHPLRTDTDGDMLLTQAHPGGAPVFRGDDPRGMMGLLPGERKLPVV